jgi:hypothetical protein
MRSDRFGLLAAAFADIKCTTRAKRRPGRNPIIGSGNAMRQRSRAVTTVLPSAASSNTMDAIGRYVKHPRPRSTERLEVVVGQDSNPLHFLRRPGWDPVPTRITHILRRTVWAVPDSYGKYEATSATRNHENVTKSKQFPCSPTGSAGPWAPRRTIAKRRTGCRESQPAFRPGLMSLNALHQMRSAFVQPWIV